MSREMMEKLFKAGQLQKEVFMTLLPESAAPHIENIKKECKEMLLECLMEMAASSKCGEAGKEKASAAGSTKEAAAKGAKKVVIE